MGGRYASLAVMLAMIGVVLFLASDLTNFAAMTVALLVVVVLLAMRALYANTATSKALVLGFGALLIVNLALVRGETRPIAAPVPAAAVADPAYGKAGCLRADLAMADLCARVIRSRSKDGDDRQAMLPAS